MRAVSHACSHALFIDDGGAKQPQQRRQQEHQQKKGKLVYE